MTSTFRPSDCRVLISSVGNTAMACVIHCLCVLIQSALSDLQWWCFPRCSPFLEFLGGDFQLNAVFDGVNRDDITVLDERNRSADLCFWNNMTNTKTVRAKSIRPYPQGGGVKNVREKSEYKSLDPCSTKKKEDRERSYAPTAETPICKTCDVESQPGAHDKTCGFEHLWHSCLWEIAMSICHPILWERKNFSKRSNQKGDGCVMIIVHGTKRQKTRRYATAV